MKIEIRVNGKITSNYQITEQGILIPLEEVELMKPVYGSLASAYYCASEQNSKKWKVQVGNKRLAKILGKEHLYWVETRKECEVIIKQLDSLLRF
jgi:hypothetical protein